ncbi:SRPBCC family protein [Sphingomonas crocodyli]|uniref:SRPBCC domain-containing protein n=1 Tax=Sphingomonas crocodyli TaxID=1979270 RepID=A0A437LWG0_9SPHN|nr:SRPBCC domain-containing protein [Sphingomonas crocodyli]RVT89724.1 SRPBCC domain-containing protein [Sphingomonas crocodyli]
MTETIQAAVVIERRYKAAPEELWALWTTRDGFESWWGPESFRVEVHKLEPHAGGKIDYDMIADTPEAVTAMKQMGQPVSHMTHGWFGIFEPHSKVTLLHMIDFVPGMEPYETKIEVDFIPDGDHTRMITTLHPHLDPHWTQMSVEGYTSQLTKLDTRYA